MYRSGGRKSFGAAIVNESGLSNRDLLSGVGDGFEFAVNRKASVLSTHETHALHVPALFLGRRPRFPSRYAPDLIPPPRRNSCSFPEFF